MGNRLGEIPRPTLFDRHAAPRRLGAAPPVEPIAFRRQAGRELRFAQDESGGAAVHVHQVDVRVAGRVPRRVHSIRHVRYAQRDIGVSFVSQRYVGRLPIGQLHEPAAGQVDHRSIRPFSLTLGLQELHGLQQRILPMPDVNLDFLPSSSFFSSSSCCLLFSSCFAAGLGRRGRVEKQAFSVFGEGRRSIGGYPPALGQPFGVDRRDALGGSAAVSPQKRRPGGLF